MATKKKKVSKPYGKYKNVPREQRVPRAQRPAQRSKFLRRMSKGFWGTVGAVGGAAGGLALDPYSFDLVVPGAGIGGKYGRKYGKWLYPKLTKFQRKTYVGSNPGHRFESNPSEPQRPVFTPGGVQYTRGRKKFVQPVRPYKYARRKFSSKY